MNNEIVYFELNDWFSGRDYPDEEPFITWLGNDLHLYFEDANWVRENKLCIVRSTIDMSINFCITTTKEWIKNNCPRLLTEHKKFLRIPNNDGYVYGNFGDKFLEYKECNFGITDGHDE